MLFFFSFLLQKDKILMSQEGRGKHDIVITNDGATILKSIQLDNPAAKILVSIL